MKGPRRKAQAAVPIALLLATPLITVACSNSPADAPTSPTTSAGAGASAGTTTTATLSEDAKTILDRVTSGREVLGAGSGGLHSPLGNTLARTADGALSVSFVFVCTGGGSASISARAFPGPVTDGPVDAHGRAHACDGSVFTQSVKVPKPAPVSYTAEVTNPGNGTFAYAWLSEMKLPG